MAKNWWITLYIHTLSLRNFKLQNLLSFSIELNWFIIKAASIAFSGYKWNETDFFCQTSLFPVGNWINTLYKEHIAPKPLKWLLLYIIHEWYTHYWAMLRCYHQKGHYAIGYSTIQPLYKKDLIVCWAAIEQIYITSQILRLLLGEMYLK